MPNLNRSISHAVAYATVFGLLLDGTNTIYELQEESGLSVWTIRKLLVVLKRRRRIYIAAWERDSTPAGRYTIAAYALGDKPDVKRPPQQTGAQRSATRDAKRKATRFVLQPNR